MSVNYYCVDLRKTHPTCFTLTHAEMLDIAKDSSLTLLELLTKKDNYDFKFFDDELKADRWMRKYKETLQSLENYKLKKDSETSITYKRRYLVLTLMREKNQTVRDNPHTNKRLSKLKRGSIFTLHDQHYFINVKLTKTVKLDEHTYKYAFTLAD